MSLPLVDDVRVQTLGIEVVFRPVSAKNAFEETVERLEQAVALGVLRVGDRFPAERQLVELLNVSRSTLREAMKALQVAGYIEPLRGRSGGSVVTANAEDVTERDARRLARELGDDLFDLLDQRRVIEPGAAELAAERATTDDLNVLYAQASALDRNRKSAFLREHAQIHLGIARLSHSPTLIAQIAQIHYRLGDALSSARMATARTSMAHVSHELILDAIAARNGPEARRLMAGHISVPDDFFRRPTKRRSS